MARSGIGINELMDTLQKSGLPFGNSLQMQQAFPVVQDAVSQQVYGRDRQIPQLKQKYHENLSRLAQMDQKLAGVYGDPSSKLYIENPVARQRLQSGASQTGYQQANLIKSQVQDRQSQLDKEVSDTVSLYKQLETMQAREEARQEKQQRLAERQGKKAVTALSKTQKAQQKEFDQYLKDTGKNITDKAKITDQKARDLFLSKPKEFQQLWIRHMLEGGKVPKKGFTEKDIKDNFAQWQKTYHPEKKKKDTNRKALF